jgi:hypothetical protein
MYSWPCIGIKHFIHSIIHIIYFIEYNNKLLIIIFVYEYLYVDLDVKKF